MYVWPVHSRQHFYSSRVCFGSHRHVRLHSLGQWQIYKLPDRTNHNFALVFLFWIPKVPATCKCCTEQAHWFEKVLNWQASLQQVSFIFATESFFNISYLDRRKMVAWFITNEQLWRNQETSNIKRASNWTGNAVRILEDLKILLYIASVPKTIWPKYRTARGSCVGYFLHSGHPNHCRKEKSYSHVIEIVHTYYVLRRGVLVWHAKNG